MIYLLIATFFWGTTFIVQRTAAPLIDPFFYNGVRFFIGGIVMYLLSRAIKKKIRSYDIFPGLLLGLVLSISINIQQIGIAHTTAGKAGFITSLYLLFVPVILSLMGHKIKLLECISLLASLVGFFLLADIEFGNLNYGDLLILLCAVTFSFHVLLVSKFSKKLDAVSLSTIQFLSCGVTSLFFAYLNGGIKVSSLYLTWFEVMYGCIFSVLIAYTFQFLGQSKTKPVVASFIMSLEGVVAFISGMIFLSESYDNYQYLGAALILISTIVVTMCSSNNNHSI